jgi:adenosylcobyric acid synthase
LSGKTLMIQGTASSAGKTLLVAALCRLFRQDGVRVAPFKAQNMALNSFVTLDGGEMGRAQVVQAEAAGLEPTIDMNPVLLKPETDSRSQVIVRGRPVTSLSARDYFSRKLDLWPVVAEALDRLRAEYELVVIEGAGSPAEINLRDKDIVNMRVALHAQSPVLLVGDIDRGGVFASLLGTLELLLPEERALVKGLVINKFRGDIRLLQDGLDMIAERTGVPVLGVIPYMRDVGVAEEDSVALEEKRRTPPEPGSVDIAVIRLPHISNFDDFDPLETEAGVSLRYVEDVTSLGEPDLVILPGTKTTVSDLRQIQASGLARRVRDLATAGTPVLGICGGYQMLGATLLDPEGVESREPAVEGLGLLPVTTTFTREKLTCRVEGHVTMTAGALGAAAGQRLVGYEIHMGLTTGAVSPAIRLDRRLGEAVDDVDGGVSASGVVAGTYMHGLFANVGLRRAVLDWLARRKGLTLSYGEDATREAAYDRLAEVVRSSLDMRRVRELCGLT